MRSAGGWHKRHTTSERLQLDAERTTEKEKKVRQWEAVHDQQLQLKGVEHALCYQEQSQKRTQQQETREIQD